MIVFLLHWHVLYWQTVQTPTQYWRWHRNYCLCVKAMVETMSASSWFLTLRQWYLFFLFVPLLEIWGSQYWRDICMWPFSHHTGSHIPTSAQMMVLVEKGYGENRQETMNEWRQKRKGEMEMKKELTIKILRFHSRRWTYLIRSRSVTGSPSLKSLDSNCHTILNQALAPPQIADSDNFKICHIILK